MTRVNVIRFKVKPRSSKMPSRIYSTPSFLVGMGSVLNVAGNYYDFKYFDTPFQSDSNSIAHDWQVVGKNMRKALEETI